jgi:hypothetical protein
VTDPRREAMAHLAAADPDPFVILRVLSTYQAHQPYWSGMRIVCRCGEVWESLCPVLGKDLADLGYPY